MCDLVNGELMSAASGLFLVDFIMRPFAKIFEKMPLVTLAIMLVLYGYIGYIVLRSAAKGESHQ